MSEEIKQRSSLFNILLRSSSLKMMMTAQKFVTMVDSLYEYCVGHSSLSGYICYTGRFRTWFYSSLQAISYPYTDSFVLISFHADNSG
jgi:hypothetical protein